MLKALFTMFGHINGGQTPKGRVSNNALRLETLNTLTISLLKRRPTGDPSVY